MFSPSCGEHEGSVNGNTSGEPSKGGQDGEEKKKKNNKEKKERAERGEAS